LLPEVGEHEMITLWDANGPVSPRKLGVPEDLAHRLQVWAEQWDRSTDDNEDELLMIRGAAFAQEVATVLRRPVTYEGQTYAPVER
jgi:hypothetical protein